jgi:hypothetical protein
MKWYYYIPGVSFLVDLYREARNERESRKACLRNLRNNLCVTHE